ncbi:histone-lysine N-methyltransferase SETMAR [Trichonephila clavipes]|nr:histone-lysine N-methyltransferase SETMAR [Trichonephila clavipes]
MKKSAAGAHRMLSNTYGEAAISERTCRNWFQRFKNGDFDVEDHQHGIWWDQLGVVYYYTAIATSLKLTDVYGEGVLTVRQCQNWFAKFRSGNFDVEDAPRSGRPVETDKDAIKALVDANRRITTREIGLRLNLSNSTVYDHLKGLGLSSKLKVWVPHVLTERNLCRRINICDSLIKRPENDPFLKRIITGDEKGHGAKKMNRLKPFPKPIFTKKKAMLSVWWDFKGIVFLAFTR